MSDDSHPATLEFAPGPFSGTPEDSAWFRMALPRSKRLREPLVEATGLLMVTSPDYSPTQAFVPA